MKRQDGAFGKVCSTVIPNLAAQLASLKEQGGSGSVAATVVAIPVSWRSKGGAQSLVLLVSRDAPRGGDALAYRVTVCNSGGAGSVYHPVRNAVPKTQRRLAVTLVDVPANRCGGERRSCVPGDFSHAVLLSPQVAESSILVPVAAAAVDSPWWTRPPRPVRGDLTVSRRATSVAGLHTWLRLLLQLVCWYDMCQVPHIQVPAGVMGYG